MLNQPVKPVRSIQASPFADVYKGKKVFITGHTGFKGSWLSLWLLQLGAIVKGYALRPYTKNDHFIATNLDNDLVSTIGDIRDYSNLKKELLDFNPEYIFHLAAQPLVRDSYLKPRDTYETNIMGTVNILNAARKLKDLKAIINITTDKCYENIEKESGYKEKEPMGGYDPYSSSKGCSELITSAYRRSFFNLDKDPLSSMLASARAGNVIGGGDWCKDRIMTDSISALMNNESIKIRNPKAVRPWQHVLEPLSGYLWLAAQAEIKNKKDYAEAWNFGPKINKLVSVQNVVEVIINNWGKGSWQDISNPNELHEAKLLNLNIEKAEKKLNWKPTLSVKESIEMTVDWYKEYNNREQSDMKDVSLSQVSKYEKIAREQKIAWTN